MNQIKSTLALFALIIFASCANQEARKPINHGSGSFLKESIERNIKLNSREESLIDSIIAKNKNIEFFASPKGYWYYYEVKVQNDTATPHKGQVAYFDYEIKDLADNMIYSEIELKTQTYLVDRQEIISGLRDGIKLMHKGETVTFLLPSNLAYGFRGDNDRIPANLPIICTVTLNDIKSEDEARKLAKTSSQKQEIQE